MKIDRLIGILVVLLGKERVQARELAERFEVSVRTILRDVDAINQAGIPIVTFQGANGGIGIAEGYRLDRSVLSGDEMATILTTLKGIDGAVNGKSHEVLMEKLKNAMPAPQRERFEAKLNQLIIDISPLKDNQFVKKKLAEINRAIDHALLLEFDYIDAEAKKTRRTVEPYSLILKTQNWYLYAWCCLRQDFRYFRVSRMRGLTTNGSTFNPRRIPPSSLMNNEGWNKPEELISLELAFNREMETVITDIFGEEIETRADGRFTVKLSLPEGKWLYGFLLSFGTGLEVIAPPHIRAGLVDVLKEISLNYSSEHDTQLSG